MQISDVCGNWMCYCRQMFGDDVFGSVNITSSGGALVVLCSDGDELMKQPFLEVNICKLLLHLSDCVMSMLILCGSI
jgi:hypothetical protein